jgi:non-ribosomal peptide synthetase component F
VKRSCGIWNIYGPAEVTIVSTCYLADFMSHNMSIPIGRPLPNYQCKILDGFLQSVIISQEGELYIGGIGVFAGYFGLDD